MHDPLVVAHEVVVPVPKRVKWRESDKGPRWSFGIRRRTNVENLGERVYPWWRPAGYNPRLAGRNYGLRQVATIWHVEPDGRDAGTVCKRGSHWKWHVWHWRVQVHLFGRLTRFLFERCIECGHRYPWGYAPVSHQWDGPRTRWRDGIVKRNYHHECSALTQYRRDSEGDADALREVVAAFRVHADLSEAEAVEILTGNASPLEFNVRYRLTRILGYERDHNYRLVKATP